MSPITKTLMATLLTCSSTFTHASIVQSNNQADFNLVAEAFLFSFFTFSNLNSQSGSLTLQTASGIGSPATAEHGYQDFTGLLSGNEYVLNGDENFDILFSAPTKAMAMDYVDTSVTSLFTLTFYNGVSNVGSSVLNSNVFNTARFVGFSSDVAFDRVTVRENDGVSNSDEFFQFYSATAVPEPGMAGLLALGLSSLLGLRRRR